MSTKGTLELPLTREELASLNSPLPHVRALLVITLQQRWRRIVIHSAGRGKPVGAQRRTLNGKHGAAG
jgi:hypothetical protein